jgi:hypothetical protein
MTRPLVNANVRGGPRAAAGAVKKERHPLMARNSSMSYSSSRRHALDESEPLPHRASHARSCAARISEKFGVHRDVVIERVRELTDVDLRAPGTVDEVTAAVAALDVLRTTGLGDYSVE